MRRHRSRRRQPCLVQACPAALLALHLVQDRVDDVGQGAALSPVLALGGSRSQARQQGLQDGLHVGRQHGILCVQAHGSFPHPLQPLRCPFLHGIQHPWAAAKQLGWRKAGGMVCVGRWVSQNWQQQVVQVVMVPW